MGMRSSSVALPRTEKRYLVGAGIVGLAIVAGVAVSGRWWPVASGVAVMVVAIAGLIVIGRRPRGRHRLPRG